jgi:hypothetical protein
MSYLWTGRFVSDTSSFLGFPVVKGKIVVVLPEIIENTNNARATLDYDGFYRSGQQSSMTISYALTDDGQGNQIGVAGCFKGACTMTDQKIDYVIINAAPTKISGNYYSTNPGDQGTFQMTQGPKIP